MTKPSRLRSCEVGRASGYSAAPLKHGSANSLGSFGITRARPLCWTHHCPLWGSHPAGKATAINQLQSRQQLVLTAKACLQERKKIPISWSKLQCERQFSKTPIPSEQRSFLPPALVSGDTCFLEARGQSTSLKCKERLLGISYHHVNPKRFNAARRSAH